MTPSKCLFVLDTNVLIHDPTALFRFQEHDLFLPMVVIEELDQLKKGLSEVARNVRQVSRFLDEIVQRATQKDIEAGLSLNKSLFTDTAKIVPSGLLYLQTELLKNDILAALPGNTVDHSILAITHALQLQHPKTTVTLVSKDINLRIKATMLGIMAEDYHNDQVIQDIDLLFTGETELPADFWETHSEAVNSWKENGNVFYRITGPLVDTWLINQCLYKEQDPPFDAIVQERDAESAQLRLTRNYHSPTHAVWGIQARNREQNFALNFLLDPNIDLVTLIGQAGTGKTLLTLAAGLVQTLEQNRYSEIIMTRATIPVGEDIGFLPGTEEEKMTPWMGALMDNLEVLTNAEYAGEWGRHATQDLLMHRIKIRSMNFMRGRTFLNKYIIIDEAQNLSAKQLKTLITRAGPGTKIVCLGNLAQIDTPYLTETTSGLTYVVDKFRNWKHSAHITLLHGERSRLTDYATAVL